MSYKGAASCVTRDHKPTDKEERDRVRAAGGHIRDNRLEGIMAVSRSLGDYAFKNQKELSQAEQMVSPLPDVREVELDDDIDFLVLATDGLWDMWKNKGAVSFIDHELAQHNALDKIGEQMIEDSLIEINEETGLGTDNITVIIVLIR